MARRNNFKVTVSMYSLNEIDSQPFWNNVRRGFGGIEPYIFFTPTHGVCRGQLAAKILSLRQ